MIYAHELLRQGGEFMGEAHSWIQRKKLNGSRVTWGSNDILEPQTTVAQAEDLAAHAAAAERNRCIKIVESFVAIPDDVLEPLLKKLGKT